MKQILLMIVAVAIVGCGKKEDGRPQSDAKAPPSTTSAKPEPQTKPKESTEEENPLSEAAKLEIARAESGDADAQHGLAVRYRAGIGLAKDTEEAAKWFRKAAEQGHVVAQWNLAGIYRFGEGVEKDHKEAAKWYQQAAEQGEVLAQGSLGLRYQYGEGVPEDKVTAYAWYNIATANGHANSKENKADIAMQMSPGQIAKGEALAKEMLKKNPKLLKKKE